MDSHQSMENENGGWRELRRRSVRLVHGKETYFSWFHPPLQQYLHKCHFATQNYKNATPWPLMLAHSLK